MNLKSTPTGALKPWRFPTLLTIRQPWTAIEGKGPQLENFRRDSSESTIAEEQTKVEQACRRLNQTAADAGLPPVVGPLDGLLNQRKAIQERSDFVRIAYALVCEVQSQELPDDQDRYWFAVTSIHSSGISGSAGSKALLSKLSDLHQARRRKLGVGGIEIGWKDLSRNTDDKDEVVWCWHVHSVVGVVAPDRRTAKAKVKRAYKIDEPHPHVGRPLDIRDTFLGVDFTKSKESLAGWLAYSTRACRLSMNIQRNKRLNGPLDRPTKRQLQTIQMVPLLQLFATLKTGDRRVLGGCRAERGKLVLTDKLHPHLTRSLASRRAKLDREGGGTTGSEITHGLDG